jgi:hypothetical protein
VAHGDRIAQIVIYQIAHPTITKTNIMVESARGHKGFGSTGYNDDSQQPSINQIRTTTQLTDDFQPYNIWLSPHPFHKLMDVHIPIAGTHPTLGMELKPTTYDSRIQLTDMIKSTPGAKLPRWRSTIKRAILLSISGHPITTIEDAEKTIAMLRHQGTKQAICRFATIGYHGTHPTEGSLMLYYDQLNVIAQHLKQAFREVRQTSHRNSPSAGHTTITQQPSPPRHTTTH